MCEKDEIEPMFLAALDAGYNSFRTWTHFCHIGPRGPLNPFRRFRRAIWLKQRRPGGLHAESRPACQVKYAWRPLVVFGPQGRERLISVTSGSGCPNVEFE